MGDLFSKRETWFAAEEFLHSVSPMVPISMSYSASSISGSIFKYIFSLVKAIGESSFAYMRC
jgi:hypothetical protein